MKDPLNYYERIQRSLDYLERRLDADFSVREAARAAGMSQSNFYRMFFALVGCPVKTHVRLRRLARAARDLADTRASVLHVALRYGFNSHESFTRAYRKAAGTTPSAGRRSRTPFEYERRNLMQECFESQDPQLAERHPGIKVLKSLPPLRVASCRAVGRSPEEKAWTRLLAWAKRHGLDRESGCRFFGFNNPSPAEGQATYGYEVWVTLPDGVRVDDPQIAEKHFPGGAYAIASTTVAECPAAWRRFGEWLRHSRYRHADHQWLEEHLLFAGEKTRLDLYMPIAPKTPDD